ncbi:MAG: GntR family transcriptional regulator [Methylobacteriaceae bacterium]|nr:GntR family transcriptional regulator [Methylobacteriaceae bacterium]
MIPDGPAQAEMPEARAGYNLSNLAYKSLSELIRTRRLKGGVPIIEAKLAEGLGLSRTPLREALQRLEGEGLVVKTANRSFMVRAVDLAEYLQSLKVREILEPEAAALALGRVPPARIGAARQEIADLMAATSYHTDAHWRSDDRVHTLYAEACGNAVLAQMIAGLRVTTRLFEIARLADRLGPDSREHLDILDAIEAGDARAARRAVQAHLRSLARFAVRTVA